MKKRKRHTLGKVALGLVAGVAVGAAAGTLLANKKVRRQIEVGGKKVIKQAKKLAQKEEKVLQAKVKKGAKVGRHWAEKAEAKIDRKVKAGIKKAKSYL